MSARMFPAFLRLHGHRAVVVGGGVVAESKLGSLLAAGARVTVVAPTIRPEIRTAGVAIRERRFRSSDLDAAWFVIAAAPPEVNRQVVRAAERRRVFVNAVDDSALATAFLGGVVERGGVTLAISTGGRAPALAGLLREGLAELLPDDLESWAEIAQRLRAAWKAEGVPHTERRERLLRAMVEAHARQQPRPAR